MFVILGAINYFVLCILEAHIVGRTAIYSIYIKKKDGSGSVAKLFGAKNSMYWRIGIFLVNQHSSSTNMYFLTRKLFFSITFLLRSCFCFCFLHPSSLHVVKSVRIKRWWPFWVKTFSFPQQRHKEKFLGLFAAAEHVSVN